MLQILNSPEEIRGDQSSEMAWLILIPLYSPLIYPSRILPDASLGRARRRRTDLWPDPQNWSTLAIMIELSR